MTRARTAAEATEANYVAGPALRWARLDPMEQWVNAAPEGGTTPLDETIGEYLGSHSPFRDGARVDVLRRDDPGSWEPATVIERTAIDEWTVEFPDGEQVWRDHHELRPHTPPSRLTAVAGRSWRDQRIDDLRAAVSNLGMTMSRSAAGDLLDERVTFVAGRMRVTPATARTYLTEDVLSAMANEIVFGFAEETPGADLMSAPRTAAVPVKLVGRVVAGLGEVLRILLVERDELEHTRDRVAQVAHAQSFLGLLLADQVATVDCYEEPSVRMPPALLLRVARTLETAADLVEGGLVGYSADPEETSGLPLAFRRDVDHLRTMAARGPADW